MTPLENVTPREAIVNLSNATVSGDLLVGPRLLWRATRLIMRTPRLLALSFISGAVTALLLVTLPFWLWGVSHSLVTRFIDDGSGWQHLAVVWATLVVFLSFFAAAALTLPNVVLAPLQDPISEAAEVQCGDFTPSEFSLRGLLRGVTASLMHTVLRLTFMALGFVVLLPLNLIPAVGSVLWWALSTTLSTFWLAVEHLSGPMSRHLYRFSQVVRALGARPWVALSFGFSLWVLLWVPVLNFFMLPIAIVAATLLFRGLRSAGLLPPPPTGGT